jgi:tRNA G10  N-methylase Trm11
MIAGNSIYANKFYKKNFFDIIAGDLPYGVQHGSISGEKQSSMTRNPAELAAACLPSWIDVLKPGGAVALSWNTNTLPRKKLAEIFEEKGLSVKNDGSYTEFGHRVDQAIVRDIIVGIKK